MRMASRGAGERGELTPRDLLRALGGAVGEEAADGTDERRRLRGGPLHMLGPRWGEVMARVAAGGVGVGVLAAAWNVGDSAGSEQFRETHGNPAAARVTSGLVGVQGDSVVKTKKFGSDVMLGAAAAASMTVSALAGDAVQWRVEDGGNGHWYQIDPTPGLSWYAARDRAALKGGALASVTTTAENDFIGSMLGSITPGPGYWLGAYFQSGSWHWLSGEPWNFTSWGGPGNGCTWQQPDGRDAVDIYCIGNDGSPHWSDNYFNWPNAVGLVIEWSADCNHDGIVDYGQILAGQLADANTNGIPDICECATHPELGACRCAGDIVADGAVNGADLGTLLAYWGPRTSGSFSIASDINSDGHIDGSDLGVLLANWGTCTPAGPTLPAWATLIEAFPDPAVVTNPALRMAIAATGLAWRVRDTGTGIEMLLVPPGAFQLGCSQGSNTYPCNQLELPAHAVTITRPYYIGRYEVTQQEWERRTGTNPSNFRGFADSASRPVDSVTWMAAQSFGTTNGLRLPTEAEWEFACRAGTGTAFYNGTNDDSTVPNFAWCPANAGDQTHPVGQLAPNALGFHDMLGNVYEWTSDWFDYYTGNAKVDPTGPTQGTYRVIRGGAWYLDMISVRSSFRIYGNLDGPYPYVGFRVARNP